MSSPHRRGPWLNTLPAPLLELEIQDVRTDEEKERDQQRQAQALTTPLFADSPAPDALMATPLPAEEAQTASLDPDIPILWTNRADMLRRRPDLADKIARLHDDELADLGGLLGQALEEFYWIQLNVVLALYLDHELHLTREVKRAPKPSTALAILPHDVA